MWSNATIKMPIQIKLLIWFYNKFLEINHRDMSVLAYRRGVGGTSGKVQRLLEGVPIVLPKVVDESIEGRGGAIPIRIYFPNEKEDLPVIVFFHGGGFVLFGLEEHDLVCRRLCRDNEAIVVAVDYRLAPEHKFPAAVHDCYDAIVWVAANIQSYRGNAEKLAVMGDSAGGNLAAVISQMARDLNGPRITAQVLIYPVIDARQHHPSVEENAEGYILTKDLMHWFLDLYKNGETDVLNPQMSPLLADNLSNLPPMLVQVAEFDPLRDEGIDYAEKLKVAGNHVQLTNYKGLTHTYFSMPNFSKKCLSAQEEVQVFLKKWFY